jgi:ribonuclease HI
MFVDASFSKTHGIGVGGMLVVEDLEGGSPLIETRVFEEKNNIRAELASTIWALETFKKEYGTAHCEIKLYSDCASVVNLVQRRKKLEANAYMSARTGAVLSNADLYKKFYKLHDEINPEIIWVKGHSPSSSHTHWQKKFASVDRFARAELKRIVSNGTKEIITSMDGTWEILDTVMTREGELSLLQKREAFLIKIGHRILMNSTLNLTEIALAKMGCELIEGVTNPRVLIGGLGMGFTLRAALDSLPPNAEIVVCEINPIVKKWCLGPMARLTDNAVEDDRVRIELEDVSVTIQKEIGRQGYDAIILDLYEGTFAANKNAEDPYYGKNALKRTKAAMRTGGNFCVWTEQVDIQFEKRLESLGFEVSRKKPGKGGPRHVVYLARVS